TSVFRGQPPSELSGRYILPMVATLPTPKLSHLIQQPCDAANYIISDPFDVPSPFFLPLPWFESSGSHTSYIARGSTSDIPLVPTLYMTPSLASISPMMPASKTSM